MITSFKTVCTSLSIALSTYMYLQWQVHYFEDLLKEMLGNVKCPVEEKQQQNMYIMYISQWSQNNSECRKINKMFSTRTVFSKQAAGSLFSCWSAAVWKTLAQTKQSFLPQIPAASDQTAIDTCKAKAAPLEVEAHLHRRHHHQLCNAFPSSLSVSSSSSPSSSPPSFCLS